MLKSGVSSVAVSGLVHDDDLFATMSGVPNNNVSPENYCMCFMKIIITLRASRPTTKCHGSRDREK